MPLSYVNILTNFPHQNYVLNYVFFFIYLVLLCWLLTKIRFIQQTDLGNRTIVILFLLRILAGLANGWINFYYYPISDSVWFHTEGIAECHLLLTNPKEYLLNLFVNSSHNSYGSIFDITDSFWNNLKSNLIIKLLSIFDIFSNGNYFINVLFYNFLVFFGSVAFYKIFIQIFADKRKVLIVTVFLLPSFLFFTSSIHRDGLIFIALAFVSLNMFYILNDKKLSIKRLLFILLSLLLIFLLRNFVFITLLPALAAWVIAERKPNLMLPAFLVIYLVFVIVFFSLKYVNPKFDLPKFVSERQMAFIQLATPGTSAININPLFPNFRSFFNNAPQAFNHSLMRPYLSEHKNILYLPAAAEILVYELLLLFYIFFPLKQHRQHGFTFYSLFFVLSMYLVIGYTIPILGPLVRYRSIYFPLIITPMVCSINLNKLRSIKHYLK